MANPSNLGIVRLTVRSGRIEQVEKQTQPSRLERGRGITEPFFVAVQPREEQDYAAAIAAKNTNVSDWPDGEYLCEIRRNSASLTDSICVRTDPVSIPV